MSATLPNMDTVAKWLDASLYRTRFRPVELRHTICRGRVVYTPGGDVDDDDAGGGGGGGGDGTADTKGLRKVGRPGDVSGAACSQRQMDTRQVIVGYSRLGYRQPGFREPPLRSYPL